MFGAYVADHRYPTNKEKIKLANTNKSDPIKFFSTFR